MIRFFICNVFLCGIIGILLLAKRLFKNTLSSRMQYHLWFLLLGLFAVPFIPFHLIGFPQIFSWLGSLGAFTPKGEIAMGKISSANSAENTSWMNDFALSVNGETSSIAGYLLFAVWIAGILAMILLVIKSLGRLHALKKSSLPLQNQEVRRLYKGCLKETGIMKEIPIYSTAFLKSPMIVGFLKPCIYFPIHLISDYKESDMRYMLLHELQHYKHGDALAGYFMNLAGILYWFNPLVWYALKEMRNDREVACDTSVLKMLDEDFYEDYGNTLINFAEKVSLTPFPFAAGLSGNMKQMKRRILNIAAYEKPTGWKKLKGLAAFGLTALLLLGLTPFVSTYGADASRYQWNFSAENVSYGDFSSYFGEYEGSFVLYDGQNDAWCIYNKEHAALRVSPNSTYKIYDALIGLEEGVLTPEDSRIPWNGETYPFEAWNADQTLSSAMSASVNWYFQFVDEQLGAEVLSEYIQKIGYGNKNISGNLSSYWMESSLKISPIEQVELLTNLYHNRFAFSWENIHAVKDALRLSSSDAGTLYGKTGTGRIDGQDVNGWFVGFVEAKDRTWFFAANIEGTEGAAGSAAAEITMSVLSDLGIWH